MENFNINYLKDMVIWFGIYNTFKTLFPIY